MSFLQRIILCCVVAFLASVAGVYVGRGLLPSPRPPGAELHDVLHHELALDERQKSRLKVLEDQFAVRRRVLELELRAANARLAEAIEMEQSDGPRVAAAVDKSHAAMGELQKSTLAHVFAMRQLLRPDQRAPFDRAVVKALTDDRR